MLRSLLLWSILAFALVMRAVSPQDAAETFASLRCVNPDAVSVLITDLKTGKTLASVNESVPLIPASIQKVVTTASLLCESGSDYRYETEVFTTGKMQDGVLHGNILVVGSGDPSLNTTRGPYTSDIVADIVSKLRKLDVDSIAGRIVVDGSIFPAPATPPSWAPADLKEYYGAGCFGFNFQNNRNGGSSVAHPDAVFISKLRQALRSNGISLGENDIDSHRRNLLLSHESAPIDEIMRSCMMRSDNMYAEALLRTFALLRKKDASTDEGTKLEAEYWKKRKANVQGVQLVDGSGLSRSNRMTASFLTDVLADMSVSPVYASFFPLAGQEGTLKHLLKSSPLEEYVALKTGSMNGIQCYAGYKLDDDYAPTHTIVIMVNKMPGPRSGVRAGVEKMLLDIFAPSSGQSDDVQ